MTNKISDADGSYLCDAETGDRLRLATSAERVASRDAGPEGIVAVAVDGEADRRCYVDYVD